MLISVIYLFTTNSKSQYRIQYGVTNIVIYCEQNSVLKCVLQSTEQCMVRNTTQCPKWCTAHCTIQYNAQYNVKLNFRNLHSILRLTSSSPARAHTGMFYRRRCRDVDRVWQAKLGQPAFTLDLTPLYAQQATQ